MLRRFVNELVKYCWLMTTATPPLLLKYDIVGKRFDDVNESFEEYYAKIDHSEFNDGCVHLVVWPSLESKDGGVYSKGKAVVVRQSFGTLV